MYIERKEIVENACRQQHSVSTGSCISNYRTIVRGRVAALYLKRKEEKPAPFTNLAQLYDRRMVLV